MVAPLPPLATDLDGATSTSGSVLFSLTCINIKDDGSTSITVYRKPTHTDQYLNFHSYHPLTHKRSVVKTLLKHTGMITEETDKKLEIDHIRNALRSNGYPESMLHLTRFRPGRKDEMKERSVLGYPILKVYQKF